MKRFWRREGRTMRFRFAFTGVLGIATGLAGIVAAQQQPETMIRGGLIVSADGRMEADVRIRGEKIAEIGRNLVLTPGSKEIDARGMLLIPGAIDTHTHLN